MLKRIKGGVHPHDEKKSTEDRKIESLPVPKKLFVPVSQHIGQPRFRLLRSGMK